MQAANVVFDSNVGPISMRIFSSKRMMDESYVWLSRMRAQHQAVPSGIDDFTLIMGYQAQVLMSVDVAGSA